MDLKAMRFYSRISGACMAQVVLVYLGYLGGDWLDQQWRLEPLGLFLGLVAALVVGLWGVIRVAQTADK